MYILHEVVEVDASLGGDAPGQGIIEHIHQHSLSAAYIAVQVQASRKVVWNFLEGFRLGGRATEQAAEYRFGWLKRGERWMDNGRSCVMAKLIMKMLEALYDT